ncbi:GNAT family N-acetyltransferase [Aphanizomenon sp. CS-733/32]|uniref:GNAT family N-acetyltransferase n=1 Tax=Aphanizomenon sp. CS-733/32 TaxID=3021715 RepID=UPI00232F85B1|nr:GNAT family N-acetyltransferase [Aphanizomenon sp. CS-733/32]MDB9310893.1 GNAT family N-acetyltransferase [Aphanizomenon sp. CS-733/32]
MFEDVIATPWDSRTFGFNTFEIVYTSDVNLKKTLERIFQENRLGHYTVKLNPLNNKKILHEFGFYYCDTLIEPYCNYANLATYQKEGIHISDLVDIEHLSNSVYGAFSHGRFHRDFKLKKHLADIRYDLWLRELHQSKQVFTLMISEKVAGFWGYSNNKILLHALTEEYRGKGLAKYFWSIACQKLFEKGYSELTSSISASNIPVLNLYSSLGFKFRNPADIYHLLLE